MIEKITIKFGMELKPAQYSWKSQLFKIHHIFIDIFEGTSFEK